MGEELNYIKDVSIDESALEVEWLEQPRIMMKYASIVAGKKKEMGYLTEQITILKAEIAKKIRKDPEKYGIVKITNDAIFAVIQTNEEYKGLIEDQIELQYELEMAKGAVTSVEHRKSSLENLVKLYGQQYFAGPNAPRDISKEWEQKQKQHNVDKGVAEKLQRRKR